MSSPFPPSPKKPARPAPAGGSVVLQARIDPALRARFVAAARKRNTTAAAALRGFIAEYASRAAPEPVEPPALGYDDSERARLVVQLPVFLKEALQERALIDGFSASAWTAALIQSVLMGTPVMTDREIEVLRFASRQLAAIGRNLNQIAKHINRAALMAVDVAEKDDLRLPMIEELRRSIVLQRQVISELVKARHRAWGSNEDHSA